MDDPFDPHHPWNRWQLRTRGLLLLGNRHPLAWEAPHTFSLFSTRSATAKLGNWLVAPPPRFCLCRFLHLRIPKTALLQRPSRCHVCQELPLWPSPLWRTCSSCSLTCGKCFHGLSGPKYVLLLGVLRVVSTTRRLSCPEGWAPVPASGAALL